MLLDILTLSSTSHIVPLTLSREDDLDPANCPIFTSGDGPMGWDQLEG